MCRMWRYFLMSSYVKEFTSQQLELVARGWSTEWRWFKVFITYYIQISFHFKKICFICKQSIAGWNNKLFEWKSFFFIILVIWSISKKYTEQIYVLKMFLSLCFQQQNEVFSFTKTIKSIVKVSTFILLYFASNENLKQ